MAQGGKWSWSDAEVHAILQAFTGSQAVRDRAWFAPGVVWGYRISELMSLKVKDVYDVDAGAIRDFITVPSCRLKGGKPKPPTAQPPKPANHDQECPCNLCHPKIFRRRSPDDRSVPMGAARPFVQAQLDQLAKTRNGLDPERYLYESRKHDADGRSKPISRQQAWHALQLAMKRAGIAVEHFGTHSLRKTSAAKMMELTKRIDVVRDWLGHRSSATTDRYLKSDNRERLAYAQAMGEQLFKHVA
jgi:integrase